MKNTYRQLACCKEEWGRRYFTLPFSYLNYFKNQFLGWRKTNLLIPCNLVFNQVFTA